MTQQKQNQLTNWLLGLATIIGTTGTGFAWNTNIKLTILQEQMREAKEEMSSANKRIDDIQKVNFDLIMRLSKIENKTH